MQGLELQSFELVVQSYPQEQHLDHCGIHKATYTTEALYYRHPYGEHLRIYKLSHSHQGSKAALHLSVHRNSTAQASQQKGVCTPIGSSELLNQWSWSVAW